MRSFIKDGVTTTMTYDADGLRSSKTVGGVKTEYQYVGDKLYYEKRGNNQIFYYFYDSYGNLAVIYYTFVNSDGSKSTAAYHVATNSQGDVIALYRNNGELYARYEYDAWGNTISITDANGNEITAWYNIAVANPIRYRGYYYDADLGLYYLQSRYYDAEIGRFVNADNRISGKNNLIMGYNPYSYCFNNPTNMIDSTGNWPSWSDVKNFFNEVVESVKVFSYIKGFFDKITTPKKVADAVSGPVIREQEHAKNVVNTIYNQENNASEPVNENFEPYEYIEARTGISYSAHIETITYEPTIEYLTDITKGRSWEEIVKDGDVDEVCDRMMYWDNVMYKNLQIYNQGDMSYTFFNALY